MKGIFKSCPVVDSNVDMNDPRWPSLREAARRFLREDGCTLSVPIELERDAWGIVQLVADHVPSKIDLPKVVIGELAVIGLAQLAGLNHRSRFAGFPIVDGKNLLNRF